MIMVVVEVPVGPNGHVLVEGVVDDDDDNDMLMMIMMMMI